MDAAREVRELLDERPDLETAVKDVLEPDPPWNFHDVEIDSGSFGELVARNIVEKSDDGYHVPDRKAVERALTGDIRRDSQPFIWDVLEQPVSINRLELALLSVALGLVVAFRLPSWSSVFLDTRVVLSGNDPYFYRFWVELTLSNPDVQLSSLPSGVLKGEPLLIATIWLISLLSGGTTDVAGHVLAWYPVISAALTAAFLYAIAALVNNDRRIGLAAVAVLAVLPGHALRTSLGFADHHAFDYLWLMVTLFGIVLVITEAYNDRNSVTLRTAIGTISIALGITAQTLAWDNSPIIVAALAPYLALEVLRAVYTDDSPTRTLGPIIVALTIAAGLVWIAHKRLGWHTELVVSAPLFVLLGGLGVMLAGELSHRFDLPSPALAVGEAVIAAVAVFALRSLRPEMWSRLTSSIAGSLLAPRPIAEVQSIFSDSFGWLLLFGFLLVLAVPYLVWTTREAVSDVRWLPPVTYAWYFLLLASIQARFVGQLSPVIAIFAGLGLVHLADKIDVAHPLILFTDADQPDLRLPDPKQAGYLVLLFLLVAGLSVVQVPVVTSKVTTPPELSDTAFYLENYSDERGLEYPKNYVFSEWGKNRVYNYFVNGQSRSYGYAQSNYVDFITSTDPRGWYDRLSGRAGFVVTTADPELEPTQLGAVLHRDNGSRTEAHPGVAHYRQIYVSGSGRYKAFELVPGAVIQGQAVPNATVTATTEVDVPGATFTYVRKTTTDASGNYIVRVAHSGTYRIDGETVTVTETAVVSGTTVTVEDEED